MKYTLDFARAERISAGSVRAERSRGTYFNSLQSGERSVLRLSKGRVKGFGSGAQTAPHPDPLPASQGEGVPQGGKPNDSLIAEYSG